MKMKITRKFKIGDIVVIKEDLTIGATYRSQCGNYGDKFTHSMRNNLGKEATITNYSGGGYVLSFDGKTDDIFVYYDDMIEYPTVSKYVFNPEVELLLQHIQKQQLQKEIDKSLDDGDKEKFNKLVSKYKSII